MDAPRATPIWAPGIGYLVTFGLLGAVFLLGPAVVALLLGVKVNDAPFAMRAGAIAAAAVLAVGYAYAFYVIVRRRQIYRSGPLVTGTIATRVDLRRHGVPIGVRVGFAFPSPAGEVRSSQELDILALGAIGFTPSPGDRALVVHHPRNPRRAYLWGVRRGGPS